MLNNSYVVLGNESLASSNLQHDVALRELEVLQLTSLQRVEGLDVSLGISIDGLSALVHSRGHPLLSTCLTILLSDSLEIGTTLQSGVDAVGSLASSLSSLATYLNLTILNRVGHLSLVNQLHYIEGIVVSSLERSCYLTNGHRVNLSGDVSGEC